MTTEREREPSVGTLLGGIVADVQELVRKEIALARQEIREEIGAAKDVGIQLAIAGAVLAIGGLFLLVTLALVVAALLNWPTWAGFGIVGAVLTIAGGVMFSAAQQRMQAIKPMPEKTIETMKEHVEWIKDRTTSDRT